MAINILGFTIGKEEKQPAGVKNQSFIAPVADDGSTTVSAGGYYGTFVDIDATAKSEAEIISRYRDISNHPDCDNAIEEIITDAIAAMDNETPVSIDLDDLNLSPKLKQIISAEFQEVLTLLDFKDKAHDIFRRWYIDGRIYYQKIIDATKPCRIDQARSPSLMPPSGPTQSVTA